MPIRSRHAAVLLGLVFACSAFGAQAQSYLRTVSWNTLHAGWSGQQDWNAYARQLWQQHGTSASSPNGIDLAFAQEVMYAESAASINAALETVSGVDWDYRVSAAIGRSSYKERYAVFFRTDRVQLLSATVWADSGDKFEREPQIVRVRDLQSGADYSFINWHTVFGTTAQRQAEIAEIANVFKAVQNESGSDQDVVLLGDHNRDATSPWWTALTGVSPTVSWRVNDKTSINTSCAFANAYDHFWFQASYVSEFSSAGRDYIADMCAFRNGVSDHAPVFMNLYSTADTD